MDNDAHVGMIRRLLAWLFRPSMEGWAKLTQEGIDQCIEDGARD